MSKAQLPNELVLLLKLTKPGIEAAEYELGLQTSAPPFNWTYFLERAIATNLAGNLLPYPELAQKYFPPFVLEKVKNYQRQIQLHSSFLREAIFELVPLFDQQHIPYALLKGWDLHFRHGISLKTRQISDIDLLIEAKDLDQVQAFFEQLGYTTTRYVYKSKWHKRYLSKHAPLHIAKGVIAIDIHTRAFSQEHNLQLELHLSERELHLVDNLPIALLDKDEAALFGLLHFAKHFKSGKTLKVGMLQDLHLYFQLLDRQNSRAQPFESLLDQIKGLLVAIAQNQLNTSKRFDEVFLRHLTGSRPSRRGKRIDILNRLKPKTIFVNSLVLAIFDLFPNKKYLEAHFGRGSYFKLWRLRFEKALGFSKGK
ncbi:MAG: putative nucleotidyltransferase [Bacteroidota bacterium]|jgi:hypothetical protein